MSQLSSRPTSLRSAQHTPALRAASVVLALALCTTLAAESRERAPAAEWTPALAAEAALLEAALGGTPPAPEGALHVRLAFDDAADLDLYVTDAQDETIYFANERAASGGRLVADARCDSPAPRIEEVVFAAPTRGRYRVGVDYMVYRKSCGEQPPIVAYAIAIDGPDGRRIERGLARRGIFDAKRIEVMLP